MNKSLTPQEKTSQNGSNERRGIRELPFEPVIKELYLKFKEIPMRILSPAYRIREMEALE